MARAVWRGSLSFGLVNIPVKLFNATAPKDVRFHQFEQGTGRRIRYRRVTETEPEEQPALEPGPEPEERTEAAASEPRPAERSPEPPRPTEPEVPFEEIVKGFEIDPGRYVMVRPEEVRALEPERTQAIEIEGFVDLAVIDPVYFEKSYFVTPQHGVGAERPYSLLLAALRETNKVGIARFVMRTREYLAAIRPTGGIVVLETLFFDDEVRQLSEIDNVPGEAEAADRELAMAVRFIDLLGMAWDPGRYRDTYRERVLELLRARAEAEGVVVTEAPAAEASAPEVPDLMAALRASVEAAKERRAEGRGSGRRTG